METVNIHKSLERKLKVGILINSAFTIFEFIIGITSGSLALISDAAQNLTDTTSLLISFFGLKISKRSPNKRKTFGYGRATIISALLNGIILLTISIYLFSQIYDRFLHPEPIEGTTVMLMGFLGIIINSSVAFLFINHRDDININSAFISTIFDAIASLGALIAGIIIYTTNSTIIDPIISLVIALMLLRSSWSILKSAIDILLEGVPKNINIDQIEELIKSTPGVNKIKELHVWAISSYSNALSCQIVTDNNNLDQAMILVDLLKKELDKNFKIKHCTIEIQVNK